MLLSGIIASRRRGGTELSGTIYSNSANYPSPYIGSTMRATAGELFFDGANLDHVELDSVFSFSDGTYIEWRGEQTTLNAAHRWMTGGASYTGGIRSGGGTMFVIDTNFPSNFASLSSSGMSAGVFYTFKIERSGDTFTLYRNGVFQSSDTLVGATVEISIIGGKVVGNPFYGTYDFLDLNGKVFNFNETGNGTTVTTG